MKLQKHVSRKAQSGDNYYKYEIILPKEVVELSGFQEGDELSAEVVKKGEIRLVRRKK
jgi:bifunctional DNA-binding transcriptional regulator/antitoxin component of YhaV-PrlF toxin-antitoxin module